MSTLRKNDPLSKKDIRKHVMIVDDDPMTLILVQNALKNSYEVTTVDQGSEAIGRAQVNAPDLIILDLNMPNVDGFEVLSQFKSHPFLSSIPILCLSGEKSMEARRQAKELGSAGFLVKPIDKTRIVSDIDLLLKSSNILLHSSDRKCHYFIGYNQSEKEEAMSNEIKKCISEERKVVMISLGGGKSFCGEYENDQIELENLFYFQIKGNVISKLPFMDDLSQIIDDLESLLPIPSESLHLIFEDPEIILNQNRELSAIGHSLMLSEQLRRSFDEVFYFSRKASGQESTEKLSSLANLLMGRH